MAWLTAWFQFQAYPPSITRVMLFLTKGGKIVSGATSSLYFFFQNSFQHEFELYLCKPHSNTVARTVSEWEIRIRVEWLLLFGWKSLLVMFLWIGSAVRWWILMDAVNVDDDLPSVGDWLLHLTFIYTLTHERRDRTRRGKGFKLVKYIFNEGFSCWSCFMSMYLCLFCPVNVLCPIYY